MAEDNCNEYHTNLLVGGECHCETAIGGIAKKYHAACPKEKNCIEIFLGKEKTKKLQENRTSIITRGWVNMLTKFSENNACSEEVRIMMGWFDRLLYIDSGFNPLTDEEILTFYDLVQVPIEFEQFDLNYFQEVVEHLIQ